MEQGQRLQKPIPSEQHLARSELNPGILSSAFAPRVSIPTFFIILVSPSTLSESYETS